MLPIPVTVEISADTAASLTGLFQWDTSSWDGGDVWAGTPRWVEIPAGDVRALSITRGRTQDWVSVDAGELVLTLADHGTGGYRMWDPSSPYMGEDGQPAVRPGMMVRVTADVGGGVVLFTGMLEDAAPVHDHVDSVVVWTVCDVLAALGRAPMDRSVRSAETSSARATWCLGVAGLETTGYSIPAGGRTLMEWPEAYATARTVLERIERSEAGRVYADRSNVLQVTWHADELDKTVVLAFSDDGTGIPYSALESSSGAPDVVNTATVTRPDGRSQATIRQSTSVAEHGAREVELDVWVDGDDDLLSLAVYYSYRRMRPAAGVRRLSVPLHALSAADLASVLGLELGQRVTVHRSEGLTEDTEATVESLRITGRPGGWEWSMTALPLDVAAVWAGENGVFTWDSSSWDGGDVWGYFY